MKRHILGMMLVLACAALAQDKGHEEHHTGVDKRGDEVMGFSHEKTVHHFRMYEDGGSIEVEAKSADDTASRDQIRSHLTHIAKMFADGNFNAPILIHDQTPPGVPVMQRLKGEIQYSYRTTAKGAAVDIRTKNSEAVHAVHEFLRFQISDHRTGDSDVITRRP